MKKLILVLAALSLVGCTYHNALPAEHAAIGFQACQVFKVDPKGISSKFIDGDKWEVTSICESGITVIIELPNTPAKKGQPV
jgi:hypothetical protein